MPAAAPTRVPRRSARAVLAVLLAVVGLCGWAGFVVAIRSSGDRDVLHVVGGQGAASWAAACFALAAPASLALLTWACVACVHRVRRRAPAGVAAGLVWLVAAGLLTATAVHLVLLLAVQEVQVPVSGGDGRVVVTHDPFDGDITTVYTRTGRFAYTREPGPTGLDRRAGPCRLLRPSDPVVACGSTSQALTRSG